MFNYVVYEYDDDLMDEFPYDIGEKQFESNSLDECMEEAYDLSTCYDFEYFVYEQFKDGLIFICRYYNGKAEY